MRYVFHAMVLLCCGNVLAAPFDVQFLAVDGKSVAGTVVMLRSTDASRPAAKPVAAEIDQLDLQFVPHVTIVPAGSQVSFPNSDSVSHQVFSFSKAKTFQLPLYRGKKHDPVLFERTGVVTLGCNIHDQMRAYVFVVDAQYFGRTDAQGQWSVADVQPGEYELSIHHPLSRTQEPVLEQHVSVGAAGAKLQLKAKAKLNLRSPSQVPANWDAY